jgi:short-subunit dehydrogenase
LKILIVGATSAIARETARLYAASGEELFLVGRDPERLQEMVDDLQIRGAPLVGHLALDLSKTGQHRKAINAAVSLLGGIDLALICHGTLPDQQACETSFKLTEEAIQINGLSVISLCTLLAEKMRERGSGTLAVITSVAGDRGRQPNFVYGSAKAMVSAYLQGLRGSLLADGVHVLEIRPGLVDSPMTSHLPKGPLFAQPETVANATLRAVRWRRNIIYSPGYWRLIMWVVRLIPEALFKRLKF